MPSDDPWLFCSKKIEGRISTTQLVELLFLALKIASHQGSNRLVAVLPASAGLVPEVPLLCRPEVHQSPIAEELVCDDVPHHDGLTGVFVLFDVEGGGAE
ncbi:hypothetical protein CVS28_05135 [Arthrobacter glacialis]|nr:hypothetical protein CVS28_05135 [Arthrobacter glacialis]